MRNARAVPTGRCAVKRSMWVKSERTAGREVREAYMPPLPSPPFLSLSLMPLILSIQTAVCYRRCATAVYRTCFPRYDKQHDASDACNVADIMHTSR